MTAFAFYTFLAQLVLFPALMLFLVWYSVKMIFARSRKKKATRVEQKTIPQKSIPVLKPLTCAQCGGSVSLRTNDTKCRYCSAPVNIPTEYHEAGRLRKDLALKLQKAQKYWRRSHLLTSNAFRWFLRLLYIWILTAMIIAFVHESFFMEKAARIFGAETKAIERFIVAGLVTTLVWTILLMVMAGSISRKTRKLLPVLEPVDITKAEQVPCGTCGNALQFDKGALVQLCDYCGVETYRAKMAWQTRNLVNESRKSAGFSLIESMEAYETAVEDLWMGPAFLVFIFVVLPFFLIVLPVVIWEYIKTHWWVLPLLLLVVAFLSWWGSRKPTAKTAR